MRKNRYKYKLENTYPFPTIHFDSDSYSQPDILCKYYSLNERNVSAVISHKVFASSPDLFNDLFDTLFRRIEVLSSHIDIYQKLLENVDMDFNIDEFKNSNDYRIMLRNTIFAIWNSKIGFISTTDSQYNDLMWSHYSNNEGFQLQFDYDKFPSNFSNPIPISYLKPDEFSEIQMEDLFDNLFQNALHKKIDWQYEDEYRILVYPRKEKSFLTTGLFSNEQHLDYEKESRLQEYSRSCVQKLILGYNFFKPVSIDENKINFGKPTGLLRKNLIDWVLEKNIKIEMIILDFKEMQLDSIDIDLEKISDLEFEIKYAR